MIIVPKTEEDIQLADLLPDGEYPFTVIDSNEVASKSEKNKGRMMFAIKLAVHGDRDKHVYDYFADWFSEGKLRHFAFEIGLGASYEAGQLDATNGALKGRQGYVVIKTAPAKGNFGPKNEVLDYGSTNKTQSKPSSTQSKTAPPTDEDGSGDVPF